MTQPSMPEEERARATHRSERRRYERASVDFPVVIDLPDGQHQARLRDVSQSGVCFFLDRRIPEMTVLEMRFELPHQGGEPARVTGSGVVVRCQPVSEHLDHYEVAVFLNHLSSENRARLAQYVSVHAG